MTCKWLNFFLVRDQMCWSAEVSLNTFLVSVFALSLALLNGYELRFVVFIMSYAFMQLIEYFIWSRGLNDKALNKTLSFVGAFLLMLQPLAAIFLLDDGPARRALLVAYGIFVLVNIFSGKTSNYGSSIASNGHLHWHFMNPKIFGFIFITYIALLAIPLLLSKYYWVALFGVVTLILSIATYAKSGTWASMWCWLLNFLSVIIIVRIVFWEHFVNWCSKPSNK